MTTLILPSIRQFIYPEDYLPVINLWKNAGEGIHLSPSDQPTEIEKKIIRDPDLFLVADYEGILIGSVIGGYDGRRGMLYHLAVEKFYRKTGTASMLLKEIERRLKLKGCLKCYLLVTPDNIDAITFYHKRGWSTMELVIMGKVLDE
jgi:ribosomal protein S18 acetylase RimI-like enzyme